jgi:hypothetical protein
MVSDATTSTARDEALGYDRARRVESELPAGTDLSAWLNEHGNRPLVGDTPDFRAGYLRRMSELGLEIWLDEVAS